jgi:non-heme chloroperoxidase
MELKTNYVILLRRHKEIKGSYLVRFEKSGHGLFLEEMDKFNAELEKFARK